MDRFEVIVHDVRAKQIPGFAKVQASLLGGFARSKPQLKLHGIVASTPAMGFIGVTVTTRAAASAHKQNFELQRCVQT